MIGSHIPLFRGQRTCLTPIDPEHDAELDSAWTHDADYMRSLDIHPPRPLTVAQIRKRYEIEEKEGKNFAFGIHLLDTERLIGFARLHSILWNHGTGAVNLAIGAPEDRGQGYASDALGLIVTYAFAELNLHRLSALVSAENEPAQRLFKRAGFVVEVESREAIFRQGRRTDALILGLLREEWENKARRGP